ncbi:MAG: nucleoside deaminase [Paludibacter sp.]|nr:nucleoside deaminase [Paludibacter sp.]
MEYNKKFMRKAIALSIQNIEKGGGPFGAVIVKDGKVIATGVNRVTRNTDPTAHAEVTAIRKASKKLGTFDLAGCDIYTSCEPCPMCLGAVYWAHIDRMYYGNTKADAKNVGFDDSFIYDEIELKPEKRRLITTQLLSEEAIEAFKAWANTENKVKY